MTVIIGQPAQLAAGVTSPVFDNHGRPKRDQHGKPMVTAKYPGLHALRHFYASWCINRKVDGGLELPPKLVQERLGHATITMTMDVYGHLFPRAMTVRSWQRLKKRCFRPKPSAVITKSDCRRPMWISRLC